MRFLYRTADAKDSPQSIARIDRTDRKGVFCRSFSWAVLLLVIDRQWIITDRSRKYRPLIDHVEMCCLAGPSPG